MEILLETNLGLGGGPNHNLYGEDQNKKQEQISRSEELNFFRKKGEKQKKTIRSSWSRVKVNTNQKKGERIAVLVTNLSLLALRLGGGLPAPLPHATPMLFIHKIYEQNFDQCVQ